MKAILCIVSILFGGLSMIAAASQFKSQGKSTPAPIMMIGSVLLLTAVICHLTGQSFDFILALLGCAGICAAAIWNGVQSKQLHIQHHVIRIALSLLLVIGFAIF